MQIPRAFFSLDPEFLNQYKEKQPEWGPLGYLVYKRTYANVKENGTMEEFWETCQRVIEGMYQIQKGHCKNLGLPWSDNKAQRSAQEAYQRMFEFKWLPPGRGLSKMGTEVMFKKGGMMLNNCGFVSTKDIGNKNIPNAFSEPFCWLMDASCLGVGVGFDTKGAGTVDIIQPKKSETFVVEDSREGWVDFIRQLLESYVNTDVPYPVADYSKVRPKGSPIKTFGGTASGPEALMLLVERISKLMYRYYGNKIDSRGIVDIANSIGECVVSGGTRRTAEIAFGNPEDVDFLHLKDYLENPEAKEWPRWASNNSVIVDEHTDFSRLAKLTAQNGEPGYLFLENARRFGRMKDPENWLDKEAYAANPCMEQTLHDKEICCLVETFPSKCTDFEDFQRTLKFAYLYAKTVTLVPTHHERTNAVMLKNRRIGCSQSGTQDNIELRGLREHLRWCNEGYKYVCELDEQYSNWLAIRPSIKKTSQKPSGSVSKLCSVREGIHESKGEYELQAIRIHDTSPLLPRLKEANFRIEDCQYARNTKVVYFPMHYPRKRKRNPTMWEQLEMAALMQEYWADNQISVTIDFDQETEGPEIQRALESYAHRLKGVSFLPRTNHNYAQPPKQVITREEYEAYKATLKPLDLSGIRTKEVEEKFCDGGLCEIK
jgi:ribonucleoside-triphosphate reductase (thioredoxin)